MTRSSLFSFAAALAAIQCRSSLALLPSPPPPPPTTTTTTTTRQRQRVVAPPRRRRSLRRLRLPLPRLAGVAGDDGEEATDDGESSRRQQKHDNPLAKVYRLYVDYLGRLWSETDVDHRRRVARRRARDAISGVRDLVSGVGSGEEYLWKENAVVARGDDGGKDSEEDRAIFADLDEGVRRKMMEACALVLDQLDEGGDGGDGGGREKAIEGGESQTATVGSSARPSSSSPVVPAANGGTSLLLPLPVVNERGELVSPAYATASPSATASSSATASRSRRASGGAIDGVSSGAADETELTKALLADAVALSDAITTTTTTAATMTPSRKKKKGRSVLFGASMGLVVAMWVYSGNYVFTALFTLMTALGQLEYYRTVMAAGIYPARRISVVGACAMFLTALFAPDLHQICLPVASTWAMIWFLTMRRSVSTISEIATTFTGMFYLGYIPSFWVRIRQIGADIVEPTRLAPLVRPVLDRLGRHGNLPSFLPKTIRFPITIGANFIFWTWLCIAFSDVGGYFAGRRFGRTKLGAISPAAGKTSPNKTIEGVVGGCIVSAVLATLGAWVQKWPYWLVVGPVHGVLLALLGLVGDLTASMLKRDAGLKDFGDLIPEHGGIMDRVDSYIFTAPYGWIVCKYVVPWLKRIADAGVTARAVLVV